MKNILSLSFLVILLCACNMSGVDNAQKEILKTPTKDTVQTQQVQAENFFSSTQKNAKIIGDTLRFKNGIHLVYKKRGTGQQVKVDNAVLINYTCKLPNGKVFDTNEKFGKPIPFLVGWGLQTPGWDFVFPFLKVGDIVEVYLPAEMARGEKGIPNLVPPNSPNILTVEVLEILKPTYIEEGVKTWVINRGDEMEEVEKNDKILIDYFAFSKSYPRYDNSFKNGQPYEMTVGAKNNMEGLNIGIRNAQLSDKLWIMIPPEKAFGKKGYLNYVKPNESVFFSLRVLKILEK